jgi:hypothetical protein
VRSAGKRVDERALRLGVYDGHVERVRCRGAEERLERRERRVGRESRSSAIQAGSERRRERIAERDVRRSSLESAEEREGVLPARGALRGNR